MDGFVHPLIGLDNNDSDYTDTKATPIDLKISSDDHAKALIISGANGGGKTSTLKSFGVVSCLAKLGVPISSSNEKTARVDFFNEILTSVGDGQDLSRGQSTFTAHLSTYAQIIHDVNANMEKSHLILLDELGAGTEANEGSAIAQALLEQLLEHKLARVVATTHSSRLKTLSFNDDRYQCASVLLTTNAEEPDNRLPTFQLMYGIIGESFALGAAARCDPPFPEALLSRAKELVLETDIPQTSTEYVHALTKSLEHQVMVTTEMREQAEDAREKAAKIQRAMLTLAKAYDRHLAFLQDRVQRCYEEARTSEQPVNILGETLEELQVVKQRVKSEVEVLKERGLKVVSDGYDLRPGESVTIIGECEWEGLTGQVVSTDAPELGAGDVLVAMSFNPFQDDMILAGENLSDKPLIFKRFQLAIWDYDSMWEESDSMIDAKSIPDSRRRLNEALSSLSSTSTQLTKTGAAGSSVGPAFKSSRERKAAKPKRHKRK